MYLPFDQLSGNARIWIYPAHRQLEPKEVTLLLQKTQVFLETWTAHGKPLQCSATVLHQQFLVIAVEEDHQNATGCAIDASIQFIYQLEEDLGLHLLDRTQIAYKHEGSVAKMPLNQLKLQIQQGNLEPDDMIFDHTVTRKGDLQDRWLIRIENSWLSRYLPASHRQAS